MRKPGCLAFVLLFILLIASLANAQTKTGVLTWDANTETDLAGYKIYGDNLLCSQLGPKNFLQQVGKVQTFTYTVPPSAFQFSFNITAFDTSGNESLHSLCVEKKFYVAPSLGSVTLGPIGTTTIGLSLGAVSDGAGGTAKYDVRYAPAPINWGTAASAPSCVNPGACTISNLTPGVTYEIQAVTYRGTLNVDAVFGPTTPTLSATTTKDTTPPAAPQNLKVAARPSDDSIILAWEQPGGEPDSNRVDRLNKNNGKWIALVAAPGPALSATVPLPGRGMRLLRVCAIEAGRDLCNNSEGIWVTR